MVPPWAPSFTEPRVQQIQGYARAKPGSARETPLRGPS